MKVTLECQCGNKQEFQSTSADIKEGYVEIQGDQFLSYDTSLTTYVLCKSCGYEIEWL